MAELLKKGTIKTSPLAMLETVIGVEILIGLINILLSLFIHYEKIYASLPLNQLVSFNIFNIIIVSLVQIIIICFSFIFWYSERYVIDRNRILYSRLLFPKKTAKCKEIVQLKDVDAVSYTQNFIQRTFGIGTLVLKTSLSPKPLKIGNIPNPGKTLKYLNSFRNSKSPMTQAQIIKMISEGENKQLEFKSSFIWDYQTNTPNKDLGKSVIKGLASFLNSNGGTLIIGVNDQKQILGIEPDLKLVKRQNTDGFENLLMTTFNNNVGIEFNHYLDVAFKKVQDKTVCIVTVRPAGQPVYTKHNEAEEFFVRSGNSSRPLSIREATEYIASRFKKLRT